jgi:hypothetical protein
MPRTVATGPRRTANSSLMHFFSDSHFPVMGAARKAAVLADLINGYNDGTVPLPDARVCLGDFSNENGTVNTAPVSNDWMTALAAGTASVPFRTLIGNHDIWNNTRTGLAAATAFGMPSLNFTLDLPTVRLIFANPSAMLSGVAKIELDTATTDWAMAQATTTSILLTHAPLQNTVIIPGADGTTLFDSTTASPGFFLTEVGQTTDATIRTKLGNTPNIVAHLSGHLHTNRDRHTVMGTTTVGSRSLFWYSHPALLWIALLVDRHDRMYSMFVEHTPGFLTYHPREHLTGTWCQPVRYAV